MKKRKGRALTVLIWLMLLAGEGLLLYPMISNLIIDWRAQQEIKAYNAAVSASLEAGDGVAEQMMADARRYNEALTGGGDEPVSYDDLLALTQSMGYVEIPKIDVYLPIYHGLEETTLQKGIGHMPESSLPVGGESTHAVLSGHTGLPAAKLFTDLDRMEEGDAFYIHVMDETLAYEVDQIKVVLPEETDDIRIQEGQDLVTLLTCTPYGVNSHRLLVRGHRIPFEHQAVGVKAADASTQKPVITREKLIWYGLTALGGVLILIMLISGIRGRRRRKKKL